MRNIFKPKPIIHHFKINFPIPSNRVQSCIKKIQYLTQQNTQAIFISFNGFAFSPHIIQTLHNTFHITNQKYNIPIYTFLQQNTTSLTYFASTCGVISANPYCMIGDIGRTHKTYTNIHKLLQFFNVKLDLVNSNNINNSLWNTYTSPSDYEKEISMKWLETVQKNMVKTISERRNIPLATVENLRNKLFTPQQALQNNLIDHISTLEQFKDQNFPQVKMQQYVYSTSPKNPNLTGSEIKLLMEITELMQMPKVALLSMQDPLNQCIRKVVEIIKLRMESSQKLQELDMILGNLFMKMEVKMNQNSHNFIF